MLILVGALIVLASTLGGFMLAGGHPLVLLQVSEFVVIFGVSLGVLVIASPNHVLKEVIHKVKSAVLGKNAGKSEFFDLLRLLYEIFMVGRRNGLIALEEHVMEPEKSVIFQRYPSVLKHKDRLEFLVNGLKPVIDGKIKPDQLEELMTAEIDAKAEEWDHPVHILQLVGDSMPGIGIVAAVLGIINTMASISEGPEKVGEHVAAALTGTLLGIFAAYGFVNPLANRIKFNNACRTNSASTRTITGSTGAFTITCTPFSCISTAVNSVTARTT